MSSVVSLLPLLHHNSAVLYKIQGSLEPRMYVQVSRETAFKQNLKRTPTAASLRLGKTLPCVILAMVCSCCFSFMPIDAAGAFSAL